MDGLMVFNGTFNNISVISWLSVSLMVETGGTGETHQPVASQFGTGVPVWITNIYTDVRRGFSGIGKSFCKYILTFMNIITY
jgi:hypothetical protein